ncbi:MAG: MipA/OmpV family protein [Lautropia sp.]|nr:MipA/OmpV family protein [Lautropia sp.]
MTHDANLSRKGMPLSGRILLIGMFCATCGTAFAQGQPTPSQQATRIATRADDVIVPPKELDDKVHMAIGLVGNISPTYSGADEIGKAVAPGARISWKGYSISRSAVVRARSTPGNRASETGLAGPLWHIKRFSAGLGISLNRGRDVSEEDRAKGLKSLRGTLIGRLRLRYDLTEHVQFQARLVGDLLGRQGGLEVPFGVNWHHQLTPKLLWTADAGLTWANGTSMRNTYGIGAPEHAASGLPLYEPGSGIREYSLSTGLTGEPNARWVWIARASLVYLTGPAGRSPLVKTRVMPSITVGAAYRFSFDL